MNEEFVFDASLMEPTPLSDAIHNRHLRNQPIGQHAKPSPQQEHLDCSPAQSRRPDPCTQKQTKKRRRNVGFATHVMVHFSPYDLEELKICWYTRADMVRFKSTRKQLYKTLNSGIWDLNQIQQSMNDDYRGLEPFFSASCNRMIQRKRTQAINSVLHEQQRQLLEEGSIDAECIRQASCSQTQWARDRGERFGKDDAEQVAPSNQSYKSIPIISAPRHLHRITPLHEPAIRP
ncbi:unnamed protein product [Cylindrotheca closterium]|uniref:Uncharacterized protein n=1 Tax=Cylindrotheca closterium TaxID=2856 RepID=A0AAD2G7S2_9STRA|nr:unnamed protein product [Cylindrotheca closterium]